MSQIISILNGVGRFNLHTRIAFLSINYIEIERVNTFKVNLFTLSLLGLFQV